MIVLLLLCPQTFVRNAIAGKGYFWLGLTDREEENVWKWVDGTLPVFKWVKLGLQQICYHRNVTNKHIVCFLNFDVFFMLLLSGSGSLASLITGPTDMNRARTAQGLSIMPTGMISTALTALVSSVNMPLTVSTLFFSDFLSLLLECICIWLFFLYFATPTMCLHFPEQFQTVTQFIPVHSILPKI